jgi:hypothetical protein
VLLHATLKTGMELVKVVMDKRVGGIGATTGLVMDEGFIKDVVFKR